MGVTFAVFGDIHGEQDLMYETAIAWEKEHNRTIDAILQVGDFETIRDESDYAYYYAPKRYHQISDFSLYEAGIKEAPFLTIFIGGNHEAWGMLAEHDNGGFVAPHMHYLGRSGMIEVGGIKIAGLTGIFSPNNYRRKRPEQPAKSWKYYRTEDVDALKGESADILLLHDWPMPLSELDIKCAENIPEGIDSSNMGNPAMHLIDCMNPSIAFAGHNHNSYLDATKGNTRIIGLSRLRESDEENSFKVITYDPDLRIL